VNRGDFACGDFALQVADVPDGVGFGFGHGVVNVRVISEGDYAASRAATLASRVSMRSIASCSALTAFM
jgi:hypothetical protein